MEAEKHWPELGQRKMQEYLNFSYHDITATETSKHRMSLENVKLDIQTLIPESILKFEEVII